MARTKAVVLRLSEEEYDLLKELSGREPMNAYLRRVALRRGFGSDVGYYPDGRRVQLLDFGPGKTAEIPITDTAALPPHTRWMPVDVLGEQRWVPFKDGEFAAMQAASNS